MVGLIRAGSWGPCLALFLFAWAKSPSSLASAACGQAQETNEGGTPSWNRSARRIGYLGCSWCRYTDTDYHFDFVVEPLSGTECYASAKWLGIWSWPIFDNLVASLRPSFGSPQHRSALCKGSSYWGTGRNWRTRPSTSLTLSQLKCSASISSATLPRQPGRQFHFYRASV